MVNTIEKVANYNSLILGKPLYKDEHLEALIKILSYLHKTNETSFKQLGTLVLLQRKDLAAHLGEINNLVENSKIKCFRSAVLSLKMGVCDTKEEREDIFDFTGLEKHESIKELLQNGAS